MWNFQNLYVSDTTGTKFTLSLKNVEYTPVIDVRCLLSLLRSFLAGLPAARLTAVCVCV